MPVRLTDAFIRTLATKNRRIDIRDANVTGLQLRVTPNGVKTWAVWYRVKGEPRRYTLGPYRTPHEQSDGLTLADARAEALAILAAARLGEDRQAAKLDARRQRTEEEGPLTVEQLVNRCLVALDLRPKTRREWDRLARVEIIPELGKRPAAQLSKGEVRDWAETILERSHYTANRAFEVLRRAYTWGLGRDHVTTTPFLGLEKPGIERESERVLSADEIAALWLGLDALLADAQAKAVIGGKTEANRLRERLAYVDAVRLLLLTGVRRDMVVGAMKEEFEDLDGQNPRWAIPGGFEGRSKSGRPHVVPLSTAALEIVRRRCESAVGSALFPVTRHGLVTAGDANKPMTWSSRFVRDLRNKVDTAFGAEMAAWTIHNLRHTVGTHLREDLHVAPEVVSLILGHTPPGPRVTRVYNRAELLPERGAALEAWATWLKDLSDRARERKLDRMETNADGRRPEARVNSRVAAA
jgi:integrase